MHYGIENLQKVEAHILLNFNRNHLKLFGTGEKLAEDTGEMFYLDFCQKCDEKHEGGWLSKLKTCKEANQTLLLKRLQNNFFGSRPLQLANISQILSFIRTTEQNKTISDGGITVWGTDS